MVVVQGSNIVDVFFTSASLPASDCAVHVDTHRIYAGGKGANQAIAAHRAGAETHFYGAMGNDAHGDFLEASLMAEGLRSINISRVEAPTGVACVFLDPNSGSHSVVVSQGANLVALQSDIPQTILEAGSTVLLQAELDMGECEKLVARTKAAQGIAIMNLAPAREVSDSLLAQLDYLIVNEHEAVQLATQKKLRFTDEAGLAKVLAERYDLVAIITLGHRGVVFTQNACSHFVGAAVVEVVDTLGAGDTFCGYFAASIDGGDTLVTAVEIAVRAAALTCTREGALHAMPYRHAITER